ncbi:MAG: hypothetical protein EOL87_15835 [Spartobacteria bacterium]|nr:hypothetical protein [Spartobacteria bacterium]
MKKWWTLFWRYRWFYLACIFLVINGVGVSRLRVAQEEVDPSFFDVPEVDAAVSEVPVSRLLLMEEWGQVDDTPEGGIVRCAFNGEVSQDMLKKHVVLHDDTGNALNGVWLTHGVNSTHLIRIAGRRRGMVQLTLLKGMESESGQVLRDEWIDTVELTPILSGLSARGDAPAFESCFIDVRFSLPVKIAGAASALRVEPSVDFSVEELNTWSGAGVRLRGNFIPGETYRVTATHQLESIDGRPLEKPFSVKITMPNRKKGITFHDPGFVLAKNGQRRIELDSVNLTNVTLTLSRLFDNNVVYYMMRSGGHFANDWSAYANEQEQGLCRQLAKREMALSDVRNERIKTSIDLRQWVPNMERGIYVLEAIAGGESVKKMFSVTDVGMLVDLVGDQVLVWANSIVQNTPETNAVVRMYSHENQLIGEGETDEQGVVAVSVSQELPFLITCTSGDDFSWIVLDGAGVETLVKSAQRSYPGASDTAYVFTDRGVYRPGEQVHMEGVVRNGRGVVPDEMPLEWTVSGPDGKAVEKKTVMLNRSGLVLLDMALPQSARMGRYTCRLRYPTATRDLGYTTFVVESFNPSLVEVVPEGTVPQMWLVGNPQDVAFMGRFYHGAPAAGRKAALSLIVTGERPEWDMFSDYVFDDELNPTASQKIELGVTVLAEDGVGRIALPLHLDVLRGSRLPARWLVELSDSDGRVAEWSQPVMVDAFARYVGVRVTDAASLRVGDKATFDVVQINNDGGLDASDAEVEVKLSRVQWQWHLQKRPDGSLHYTSDRTLIPVNRVRSVKLNQGRVAVRWDMQDAGEYAVQVRDLRGATCVKLFSVRGASDDQSSLTYSMDDPTRLKMEAPEQPVAPGSAACIRVTSPFLGRALVVWETDSILNWDVKSVTDQRFDVTSTMTTNEMPNAYCRVNVIRRQRVGDMGPFRAVGVVPVAVQDSDRLLSVDINHDKVVLPQTPVAVDIIVTDQDGLPVADADVTIWAVDEAVCAWTGFETPDPLGYFRSFCALDSQQFDVYGALLPERTMTMNASITGGGLGMLGRLLNPVDVQGIQPLVKWLGLFQTDAQGRIHVSETLPEYAGRLRWMAVAVKEARMGSGRSDMTVRRPVTLQAGMPRFLAPGDRCEVPVDLFTYEDGAGDVQVSCSTEGPLQAEWDGTNGLPTFSMPKKDMQQSAVLSLTAEPSIGAAKLRCSATSDLPSVQRAYDLAIRPATTYDYSGRIMELEQGQQETIQAPSNWLATSVSGDLWIGTVPTVNLVPAMNKLMAYPYGCLEQTTSKIFAQLCAQSLITTMQLGDVEPQIRAGMARIASMQHADGSMGYWPDSKEAWRWGTAYAGLAMGRALRRGIGQPYEGVMSSLLQYLERELAGYRLDERSEIRLPAWIPLACWTLAENQRIPHSWLNTLLQLGDGDSLAIQGYTMNALIAAGRRAEALRFMQKMETPSRFPESGQHADQSYVLPWALMLMAWNALEPASSEALDYAAMLCVTEDGRGTWFSTMDNAWAVSSLAEHYLHLPRPSSSTVSPAVKMNGVVMNVPEAGLRRVFADVQVTLENTGTRPLFCTTTFTGVPLSPPAPESKGLTLQRTLRTLQDRKRITADADQRIHVMQGESYLMEIDVDTWDETQEQLVIQQLLPAGFEVDLPALSRMRVREDWAALNTMSLLHFEARDDRVLIFPAGLRGKSRCVFPVRALNRGCYQFPGVRADSMYNTSAAGQTIAQTLVVE